MRATVLPAALLALALALPASASQCVPTTSSADIDTYLDIAGVPRHYVLNDCPETGAQPPHDHCLLYPIAGWWIYEESNGIFGLQRQDEVVDDTCGGLIDGDTIVF